ncbi:hypothetical protein VOLCADRAFT_95212 [Volvox carteri f. nagariensis]|uniref:Uncharacterized protein n=1 Tax=Volvox carteri f. nagariensis TaxID=3068 RepID=D8U6X1_VOLCA|nr:uncharacterized protein VOLCADRAFT_95212 [Volvox carteri f. nagariensis]EFJ44587.1 hypothetical protein VOLCADRAFT_95212 [Volvox carteri f. nagariensis]|eukprot:XP_002954437.1 hypothetical protein VOLCADRAFT_95212 [Volvox carteri f. nagariensis]
MELEDFDEDGEFRTSHRPSRSPLVTPQMQSRSSSRRGNTGNFGLANEAAADAAVGLAAELQRLDVQGPPQRQSADGFGLEADAVRSQPSAGRIAPLGPPLPSRTLSRSGAPLAPLGSSGSLGPPRTGPGLSPLRSQRTLQDPGAFGLAAEAAERDITDPADPIPGPTGLGLPASRPPPQSAFGLSSEVELRSALPPSRQQPLPPSPLRPSPLPSPSPSQRRYMEGEYGLERDVQDAVSRPPSRRPSGGYGLAGEVASAAGELATRGPSPPPLPLPPLPPPPLPPPQQGRYGLEEEVEAAELWSRPLDGTVSLEQLSQQLAAVPDEQRWLHLEARQAERIMMDLAKQGTVPKVVDLKDVRHKLIEASNPPRLAYLAALERAAADKRLPPNCRPSLLQAKLKSGQNRLRKLLDPVLDPGGQGFVDFNYRPDGALLPENSRVWQFGLSLVQADGVGKTGLQRSRLPCLFIARLALFDRRANRFLGNVLGLRPEAVSQYDKRWEFNPEERVIVRCGCVQSDPQAGTRLVTEDALSVFVEFSISYRLSVPDTINMPQNEQKCSQLLDEITTCWAMISFKKCTSLTREVEISVPLYYGSIYDPKPMAAFYAEKRSKSSFWSTALKPRESPVLQFRVGPLNTGKPPLVPHAYMPPTMLATHDLGTALAAYRMSLSLTLARQGGPFVSAADPVLAGFPPLLSDHHLLAEFLTRWRDLTHKMTAVLDADGHRLRLVQHYCHVVDTRTNKIIGARNPVEPLSHAGFEFLHAPFDVSEIRVCMADRVERPEPFYRH